MDIFINFKKAIKTITDEKPTRTAHSYHPALEDMPAELKQVADNRPILNRELVGDKIKKMREDAGLTQVELAKIVGTHQPAISKWERGNVGSLDSLVKVADVFSKILVVEFRDR